MPHLSVVQVHHPSGFDAEQDHSFILWTGQVSRLMERANAMVTDAAGTMLALADPVAADAANALVNLNGAGHCSDTILAGAGLTVY